MIPHTHWDREWYLSFEQFRDQLVETMDLVLELLDRDDRWTHFHLDGQTAMIDDYLEVRPEREAELGAHISEGRLSCGPWTTLVDEFLVSGESIIRDLEDGLRRADQLGGALRIGYLPDQFGHVGQMPQLLRLFGIDRAVVWRGVPREIVETSFMWSSPDGSRVEVLYLPFGYGHGRKLAIEPDLFSEHLQAEATRFEEFLGDGEPLLVMLGGDHVRPAPSLPDRLDESRRAGLDIEFTSLLRIVSDRPAPARSWSGELRSAARANLLPNTYSARIAQKMERARAEHLIERYAEPLAALVPGVRWPEEELRRAWQLLHLNGAHDSVCGCSTDEVARAVDARTEEVQQIAISIATGALEHLAAQVAEAGTVTFNPSPFERDGVPALGWRLTGDGRQSPVRADLVAGADGARVHLGGEEVRFTLEDQGDEGDLYTFSPSGDVRHPEEISQIGDQVRFVFDTCDALVAARMAPGEPFVRLTVRIDNRSPDHRLRLVCALPERVERSRAGSVFEIVDRPMVGEGGHGESPSPCWPARGFCVAGGRGILSEGVFEYELTGDALAMTLLRCVGTISRHELRTRKRVAGPDVATPGAQMIGTHRLKLGLMDATWVTDPIATWERYALPLLHASSPGGGELSSEGTLLDMDIPALSSIRRRNGDLAVTVWNPAPDERSVRIGSALVRIGPHRIETTTAF